MNQYARSVRPSVRPSVVLIIPPSQTDLEQCTRAYPSAAARTSRQAPAAEERHESAEADRQQLHVHAPGVAAAVASAPATAWLGLLLGATKDMFRHTASLLMMALAWVTSDERLKENCAFSPPDAREWITLITSCPQVLARLLVQRVRRQQQRASRARISSLNVADETTGETTAAVAAGPGDRPTVGDAPPPGEGARLRRASIMAWVLGSRPRKS